MEPIAGIHQTKRVFNTASLLFNKNHC